MKVLFLNPQQEMGGIQCLSALLKQNGHETALVNDPNLFDNPWVSFPWLSRFLNNTDHIIAQIDSHKPDLVALSVVTDDLIWALNWAKKIKQDLNLPIVIGNVHPTFHPYDCLKHEVFDYIVRGEGEYTLLELVNTLESNGDLSQIQGLAYHQESGPKINPMRPLISNLDELPFPDKDLYYAEMPYLNRGYTTMTGRGCPYKCTFCDNNSSMQLYKKEVSQTQKWTRRHSPEYVVEEILWAKNKYGIKHVRFNDEDFSYDKKWLRQFCPLYKEKVGIPYFAWVYPNTIDEEMASLLADSGCDSVEMGVQSGAEKLRNDVLNRRTKNTKILTAMKALRNAGIRTTIDIIIGLPTETKQDLDSTVKLLSEGRPWHLYAFWLRYYPSTEILTIAKERGLLSPEDIHRIESNQNVRGHLAGGTELEKDGLSRSYHAFIVLIPIMPNWFINFCLKKDLIQYFPSFINPFLLVNFTKALKPNPYDEFRSRGWLMIFTEGRKIIKRAFKKVLFKEEHKLKNA